MLTKLLAIGIDLGSVTAKLVLIDKDYNLLYKSYEKHSGTPLKTICSALKDLKAKFPDLTGSFKVCVTGSGKKLIHTISQVSTVNEIVAQAIAASRLYPCTRTVIEIGGQDSKFIELEIPSHSGEIKILNQRMNDICAAGTGVFIEQQAERLGINIEEFGNLSMQSKRPALVAGRCAVFSKSDGVHLLQEGVPKEDIAAGICNAVVRNYIAQFSKGREIQKPILFQGGLAANQGVVEAFKRFLKLYEKNEFIVAANYEFTGAIGAAIVALDDAESKLKGLDNLLIAFEDSAKLAYEIEGSILNSGPLLRNDGKVTALKKTSLSCGDIYIGVDVGSTSTCVVALDYHGHLIDKCYLLNKGELVNSAIQALGRLGDSLRAKFDYVVAGVGVTGSGRYLISKLIGADITKDEISAQVKAATIMFPNVDTIIEIGGQDSKYIQISGGRVIDFNMNKACAAGTGSFLQEQAERLNEKVSNLSDLAFQSKGPCNLTSRCTVFMESDLINFQQMGISKQDLAAGLSYAVVRNYLEKVVEGRLIGNKIVFLGGVAYNDSVVSAFQQVLKKELIVPAQHEVSAAIGIAQLTKEAKDNLLISDIKGSKFKGFDTLNKGYDLSFFECTDCSNSCRIGRIKLKDSQNYFCYGGTCGKHDRVKEVQKQPNLLNERNSILLSYLLRDDSAQKERIGIPRIHLFYELFPLYCVYLQELGYEVIISDETNDKICEDGLKKTVIDNCFASKIVYGHIENLIEKNVKRVFLPSVIEFEREVKDLERNYSCPHIQGMPSLIQEAFSSIEIISPVFYRNRNDSDWKTELQRIGISLNHSLNDVNRAIEKGAQALAEFKNSCENLGKKCLAELLPEQKACVIMGKIYNVYDSKLNMGVVDRLYEMGVTPFPYDCLPLSQQNLPVNFTDMVWSEGQDLIRAAKYICSHGTLSSLLITNFGCGPDSFIIKYLKELLGEKAFLVLEVDEHFSDVGLITRIEAFLNNIQSEGKVDFTNLCSKFQPFIPSKKYKNLDKLLYVPWSLDSDKAIAAAFSSIGVKTKMLPRHDEETEYYGRLYSSGRECLPYIMQVGDAVRMTMDSDFEPNRVALFVPGTDIACRVSLFSTSIKFVLRTLGVPEVPVIAPRLSMDTDETTELFGVKFARNIFRGTLTIEYLSRMLTQIRPYEVRGGESDQVYEDAVDRICNSLVAGNFVSTLKAVLDRFGKIEVSNSRERPVVGLIGDDYTRGNYYANNNFARQIEALGGQVLTMPIMSSFFEFQMGMKPLRTLRRGKYFEYILDIIKLLAGQHDVSKINSLFKGKIDCFPDARFSEMIDLTSSYVDERSEPLIIIALSHLITLMQHRVDGVANLIGFQCMIHSMVSGFSDPIFKTFGDVPKLTLYYDLQEEIHHLNRIEAFMYQVCQNNNAKRNR